MSEKESNKQPLVSVLMTAHNREKYIAEAIESVLASTYKNFELIIVDDCSTDRTVEIVKDYYQHDKRVRVYVNEMNLGQFANRNKSLEYAKGDLIKYFDSDDIMKPICLETMVQAMEMYPAAIAGAEHHGKINKMPICYSPRELYINHYFKGNNLLTIGPSGAIFRKKAFEEFGGFDLNIGILADTLFMLKIGSRYPVVGFEPNTFIWRRHDQQVTVGQEDKAAMAIQRNKINDIVLMNPGCPFDSRERNLVRKNLNNILIRNIISLFFKGEYSAARDILGKCRFKMTDFFSALMPNKILHA